MKKKRFICSILASCILGVSLTGCQQTATKSFGGDMIIELDPGEKLELITWKEDSLWYLTRPMREDEKAETHVYEQSSEFGIFEGSVTIKETNKEDK